MVKDLREFISKLEEEDQLKSVDSEVSPDLEASAHVIKSLENRGPALMFENIRGFKDGYRLASGLYSGPGLLYLDYSNPKNRPWTRTAIALGMDTPIFYEEFIDELNNRYFNPTIKPIQISEGPCKEKVKQKREAKLSEFPIPKPTKWDGGNYINAGCVITKDPESGKVHIGKYNCMVKGDRDLVINAPPGSELANLLSKHNTLPINISIGGPPSLLPSLYTTIPPIPGISELEYASSIAKEPVSLNKGEINEELIVPATSEVVIEGEVNNNKRTEEGPYLNFYQYIPSGRHPTVSVRAITHREDPIIPFFVESARHNDSLVLTSLLHSAELVRILRPRFQISWLMCPQEAGMSTCIVSTKNRYPGYLWFIAYHLFTSSRWFDKVIFVENTVLPEDSMAYWNHWLTKADPSRSWYRDEEGWPRPLSARYPVDPKKGTSRIYIDATWNPRWPEHWKAEMASFENCYPEEIQNKVLERWKNGEYGYKVEPYVRRAKELPLR